MVDGDNLESRVADGQYRTDAFDITQFSIQQHIHNHCCNLEEFAYFLQCYD